MQLTLSHASRGKRKTKTSDYLLFAWVQPFWIMPVCIINHYFSIVTTHKCIAKINIIFFNTNSSNQFNIKIEGIQYPMTDILFIYSNINIRNNYKLKCQKKKMDIVFHNFLKNPWHVNYYGIRSSYDTYVAYIKAQYFNPARYFLQKKY